MKLPQPGDRFDKKELIELLQKAINKANTDSSGDYAKLRRIFNAVFEIEFPHYTSYNPTTRVFQIKTL